ncbi:hypothetical protein ACFP3Q_16825 [Nocardioides sp. GCM10027113]|uniref:hypothetical protein n=1 Tax=unclassified Nocardioides TaxID=2615069 RepID=UPI00360F2823
MNKWIPLPLLAALLLPVLSAQAEARPLERERFSFTESFTDRECGFPVHFDVEGRGLFLLKAPRRTGFPALVHSKYRVHAELTANGRTLFFDHNGLYKDLRVERQRGSVFRVVAQEAGQPFRITAEDGTVLYRDRGLLRYVFLIDTHGDDDPGNDEFIEGSFELLADRGSHPIWYLDLCDVMADYFLD